MQENPSASAPVPTPREQDKRIADPGVADPIVHPTRHEGHFPGFAWDWFWAAVMILFAVFVLTTLTRHGIWTDELSHRTRLHDPAPWQGRLHPLHLMIARADVLLFGFSDFALRLPWAIIATLGIPVAYALGRLLGGRALGRIACLVLATSPYYLHYARDANYYSELMTYALVGAWGAAAFIQAGTLVPAIVALAAMAAMTLTHPMSGICAVSLASAMAAALLGKPALRRSFFSHFKGHFVGRRRAVSLVAFALGFILLLTVWLMFGRMIGNVVGKAWSLLAWRGGFANMDLGWTFLASAASEYAGGVLGVTRLSLTVAAVYTLASLIGLAALLRGGVWRMLPVLAPFVAVLLILRFLKIDRFFHIRYIDFLAPLWLVLAGAGVWAIGQSLAQAFPHYPRLQRWLVALPVVVLLAFQAPQARRFATFDGGYLKNVMRYLKPVLKPGERVLTIRHFGPKEEAEKLGLKPEQFVQLPYNFLAGQQRLQDAYANLFFARTASPWVLLHWNDPKFIDPILRQTLIGRATPILLAPSIFEMSSIQEYRQGLFYKPEVPVVRAELYRWNWPNRYVCSPQPYEVNLANEDKSPAADWMRQRGLLARRQAGTPTVWKSRFLFERENNYLVTITPPADQPTLSYRFKVDDREMAWSAPAAESKTMQFPIRVKTGEHTLTIEPMGAASPNATWLPRLRIEPDVSRGVTIDPLYFTRTNPTNMYLRGEREQGRMALVFDRNEGVEYDFEVRQAGAYRVSFQALEDQPGPVLLEVALDGRTQGVLAFSRADLSWSSQTLIANLPVGKHTLGVNAASEQDVGAAEPEKNNNLVLAQIDLVAATAGDTDERFHLGDELNLPPVTIANGFVTVGSESSELSWNLATYQDTPVDPDLRYQLEPDPGAPWPQATTVHFSMPAKGADTKLVSPVFRVKPATIIYYRAELRVENLLNHSANMQLLLFDKDGVPIDVIHARAQGITGSTPWVPFVFIDALPDDAASAALACVVYQNGKMTAPKGGEAFFRRLEWPMVLK